MSKRFTHTTIVSTVLISAFCASAVQSETRLNLKPGKWVNDTNVNIPNLPAQTHSNEICITPEQASSSIEEFMAQSDSEFSGSCEIDVTDDQPGHYEFTATCGGINDIPTFSFDMTIDYTETQTTSVLSNNSMIPLPDAQVVTVGNWVGECD